MPTGAKPFLDTNVLIYAFAADDWRSERAEALVAAGGVISVQVLNEFVNLSRRKLARSWSDIKSETGVLRALLDPPVPLTIALHEAALFLARDGGLALDDALIIAAAARSGCSLLYSEDMQYGRTFGRLTICNPFS